MASEIILQGMQVLTVLCLSPLLHGISLQCESRVLRGKGISVFQPYRDLWKLFHKQQIIPEGASWLFVIIPITLMTLMLIIPMLIPVLTNFPLVLSGMADILGGGFLLEFGGFLLLLAGLEAGSSFGSVGSSRAAVLSILSAPVVLLVLAGIATFSKAMIPFVTNHLLVNHPLLYLSPVHLFLTAAFFIIILYETGHMPVHSGSCYEIYMIDEARILEYSGPLLAIIKWASMMKHFIFYTLFINLLFIPWGLSSSHAIGWAFVAIPILLIKYTVVVFLTVTVDTIQSRLRFFRYHEPLVIAFVFALFAILLAKLGVY